MKLWTTIKNWSIWKRDWWRNFWKELNKKPMDNVLPGDAPQDQNQQASQQPEANLQTNQPEALPQPTQSVGTINGSDVNNQVVKESLLQEAENWTEQEWNHFKAWLHGEVPKVEAAIAVAATTPVTAIEGVLIKIGEHSGDLKTLYDDLVAIVTRLDPNKVIANAEQAVEKDVNGIIGKISQKASVVTTTLANIRDVVNALKELI